MQRVPEWKAPEACVQFWAHATKLFKCTSLSTSFIAPSVFNIMQPSNVRFVGHMPGYQVIYIALCST
jgi:hypothetical protein